jgi:hypothetical protein
MNRLRAFVALIGLTTLAAFVAGPAQVRAEHMIEIGGGAQARSFAPDTAVLLKVGYSYRDDAEGGEYYVARMKAQGALGVERDSEFLPYAQVEFTPFERYMNKQQFNDLVQGIGGRVARSTLGRELGLGQDLKVSVSVIGIRAGMVNLKEGDSGAALFAQLAADFLGYRLVKFSQDRADYTGMQIADVMVEAGAILSTGKSFSVRVSGGGTAAVSQGTTLMIDSSAFAGVRVDIAQFLQFFVRGSASLSRLSVKDADAFISSYTRAEAGMALIF